MRQRVALIWTVLIVVALIVEEVSILTDSSEDAFGLRDAFAVMAFFAALVLWGIGLGVIAFYAWLINEIRARGR